METGCPLANHIYIQERSPISMKMAPMWANYIAIDKRLAMSATSLHGTVSFITVKIN